MVTVIGTLGHMVMPEGQEEMCCRLLREISTHGTVVPEQCRRQWHFRRCVGTRRKGKQRGKVNAPSWQQRKTAKTLKPKHTMENYDTYRYRKRQIAIVYLYIIFHFSYVRME